MDPMSLPCPICSAPAREPCECDPDVYQLAAELSALKVQLAAARALIAGLDGLLVCYRLGSRPTDKLLDSIKASRAALATTADEGGET